MSKRKKKVESEELNIRCWGVVAALLLIIGILFVNSRYLGENISSTLSFESGILLATNEGYGQQDNFFEYTGDENSYIQIPQAMGSTNQLMLAFETPAKKDTTISLNYVDHEGNIMETVTEAVWEKGEYCVKIDLEHEVMNSYLLHIPENFTLSRAVYSQVPEGNQPSRVGSYFLMFFMVVILLAIFIVATPVKEIIEGTYKSAVQKLNWMKKEWKVVCKNIGIYIAVMVVAFLFALILSKCVSFDFTYKIAIAAFVFGSVLYLCIFKHALFAQKLEWMGFWMILLTGFLFAFTEPVNAGVSWDDQIHYKQAVQLSHFFDDKISLSDSIMEEDCVAVSQAKKNYTREEQIPYGKMLNEIEASGYYVDSAKYSFNVISAAYLPSAIGLALGRGLGLPFTIVYCIGRWMNSVLMAILAYHSIKRIRSGKLVVLLIALLPTIQFLSGNYTYDIWLLGWSMLGLSTFFGEWQRPEEKIKKNTIILMAVSLFLSILPKQVYFPLCFIPIFMPASKFENKKQAWIYRGVILATAILPFVAVFMQNIVNSAGTEDVRGGSEVNSAQQLAYIKSNLSEFGRTLGGFLKGYLNPLFMGREYLSFMAYVGYLPISVNYIIGAMVVGALVSREEGETKFPWWTKAGVLLEYVVIGAIAAVSMYVVFTSVGATTVSGCQGRYLLPSLFPLLFVCSRFSGKTYVKKYVKEANINIIFTLFMMVTAFWGYWAGCLCLY